MKFSTHVDYFKRVLSVITRVSGRDKTTDVGDKILISAKKDGVRVRAVNLESGVEFVLPSDVESEGEVLVTGSVLEGVVSSLVTNTMSVEHKDGTVCFFNNTSVSSIKPLAYEGFPDIPDIDRQSVISVEPQLLIDGFRMVLHAVSQSIVHPEYTGVYITTANNTLYFVATDGHRLAEARFSTKSDKNIATIVPLTGVQILSKFLDFASKEYDTVDLVINESGISITKENSHIYTRIINKDFPDYKKVIPAAADTTIHMLKTDLFTFLKKAKFFVSDNHNTVEFLVEGDAFQMSAFNDDVGTTKDTLEATIEGNQLKKSFNYKYINDTLMNIDDDRIMLKFNDDITKPLVISGADTKVFMGLVMPSFTQE